MNDDSNSRLAMTGTSATVRSSLTGNDPSGNETSVFDFSGSNVVLAPMEGVTDAPMREFLTAQGGYTFCVAEFLRISHDVPPPKVFRKHLPELQIRGCVTRSGTPVVLQLLGGDAERMAESAARAVELGVKAIDINFGCPAPTVNRHDGGAVLLKEPKRIEKIVRAVRSALPSSIPVSAKLRLGWESIDEVDANAEAAAAGGASWLTLHARTRMAGYAPPAYWGPVRRVHDNLKLPVIANGDLWTLDEIRRCYEETGCLHFMLGRSALADPGLAKRIPEIWSANKAVERGEDHLDREMLRGFTDICRGYGSEETVIARRIKQWASLASRHQPLPWFEGIKRLQTADQILAALA